MDDSRSSIKTEYKGSASPILAEYDYDDGEEDVEQSRNITTAKAEEMERKGAIAWPDIAAAQGAIVAIPSHEGTQARRKRIANHVLGCFLTIVPRPRTTYKHSFHLQRPQTMAEMSVIIWDRVQIRRDDAQSVIIFCVLSGPTSYSQYSNSVCRLLDAIEALFNYKATCNYNNDVSQTADFVLSCNQH